MKRSVIAAGEYYHIYNRGNNRENIFINSRDYARFIFLILFLQSPALMSNVGQSITYFIKHSIFNISHKKINEIITKRTVELVSFSLMFNHFHLIVYEKTKGGISRYMQRVQDAYAKYFNIKYKRSGHVFGGRFGVVHIKDNNQLLYLSSYIHRNPREIKGWKDKEHKYPWSSYRDYVLNNRWGNLLKTNIILEQFKNLEEYQQFTKISIAKEKSLLDERHIF